MSKPRVFVAVDIENLWYGARIEFGKIWRVNYEKLRDLIIGLLPEDAQVEAIAYVVISENHDNRRFMMTLDKLGYVIKKRYMRYTKVDGASKSDWDVGITVDVLKRLYEEELEIFVLVSGDGDYCFLLDAIKKKSKKTIVVTFSKGSNELKKAADETAILNKHQLICSR